jgi:hypothetical protein
VLRLACTSLLLAQHKQVAPLQLRCLTCGCLLYNSRYRLESLYRTTGGDGCFWLSCAGGYLRVTTWVSARLVQEATTCCTVHVGGASSPMVCCLVPHKVSPRTRHHLPHLT